MGLDIKGEFADRTSSFLGRFDVENKVDMHEFDIVRDMVSRFNYEQKLRGSKFRLRVCKRGRAVYEKQKTKHVYSWCNSKGEVTYDYFGNTVGGVKNMKVFDAYLYKVGEYYVK